MVKIKEMIPDGGIGNLNIFGNSGEPYNIEDFLGTSTPQDLGFISDPTNIYTPIIPSVENTPGLPQILAGQSDFEKNLLEPEVEQEDGLGSLKNLIPGSLFATLLSGISPQDPPEVRRVKDFYARNFGVNTAGSVGSGIMQGYNPVSGGFLNYMTGGRFGEPMQVGLGRAMQGRIENILGRKAPQTDASRAKVEELRNLQLQEMRDRAAGGESLGSIGKSTFSGKGGAFEARPSSTYSRGFAGGR